jgi:hypothetical protein
MHVWILGYSATEDVSTLFSMLFSAWIGADAV